MRRPNLPGILPRDASEIIRVLQARRMDSDYGDYIDIGIAEAADSVEKARRFVEMAGKTLEKLLKDAP
jgi:uncharacterized protein (UPF0332 family)